MLNKRQATTLALGVLVLPATLLGLRRGGTDPLEPSSLVRRSGIELGFAGLRRHDPVAQERPLLERETLDSCLELGSSVDSSESEAEAPLEPTDHTQGDIGAEIDGLLQSSLGKTPPTIAEVEQVLGMIAEGLTVDETSLRYDENGQLLAGRMGIEGTDLVGEITMDGGSPRLSIPVPMTEPSHFFMRAIDVNLRVTEGSVGAGTTVLQHHPNTLQDAPAPPAGNEPFVCGWSLSSDGAQSTFSPTEAVFLGQSEGWSVGRLGNVIPESYPGHSNLGAFDRIYGKLAAVLKK